MDVDNEEGAITNRDMFDVWIKVPRKNDSYKIEQDAISEYIKGKLANKYCCGQMEKKIITKSKIVAAQFRAKWKAVTRKKEVFLTVTIFELNRFGRTIRNFSSKFSIFSK